LATTKLFPITATEAKALAYIANPNKTENGSLIITSGCSTDPYQASRDFSAIRATGTGLNTVLSQHFIQSFQPGEITPDQALEVGRELCERFLKDEYQYFLAVHTDKEHIHLHCIFNNVSSMNGRTFETNMNQGKVEERAWKKLRDISDQVCREHNLTVISHPDTTKGKSHWEWDMTRQGMSWKAKLKYAIDNVIMDSENFEDFLEKCKVNGILVDYNPNHKIDLKFMLAEHKERNPRAKYTRAKTLGWFYTTEQIKRRIEEYISGMMYTPRTKIRQRVVDPNMKFLRDAIDRGNMKLASIAKNTIARYGIELEDVERERDTAFSQRAVLVRELNTMKIQIEDYQAQLSVLMEFRKYKPVHDELKTLSGRQAAKFRKEHPYELNKYGELNAQLLEWYPAGRTPTVEALEKKINALIQERSEKDLQFRETDTKFKALSSAKRDLDEFLSQERNEQQQDRKRKKNGDLE